MPTPNECRVSWNGSSISITAHQVPRWAWSTASIDVAVDGHTILQTRGVFKFVGKHIENIVLNGKPHIVELAWGRASLRSFPFNLSIDNAPVANSRVPIQNWWVGFWPWAALLGYFIWRYTK